MPIWASVVIRCVNVFIRWDIICKQLECTLINELNCKNLFANYIAL